MAECGNSLELWGNRYFYIDGVMGSDVIGFEGAESQDLGPIIFDPENFGMAPMDSPGQVSYRSASGSFCSSGVPVIWGVDNSPTGETRSSLWRQEDGQWIQELGGYGAQTLAILQEAPEDDITVLSRSASEPEMIMCHSFSDERSPTAVFGTSGSARVASISAHEKVYDANMRAGRVAVLIGDDVDPAQPKHLRVVELEGCSPGRTYDLIDEDGSNLFSAGTPSVAVGPEGRIVLAQYRALYVSEYQGGEFARNTYLEFPYDPSEGGVSSLDQLPSGEGIRVLAWALRDPVLSGADTDNGGGENQLWHFDWVRLATVCIRDGGEGWCLPESDAGAEADEE